MMCTGDGKYKELLRHSNVIYLLKTLFHPMKPSSFDNLIEAQLIMAFS